MRWSTAGLSRPEAGVLTALFAALLVLRVAYAFAYPVDSDEPQHLHVAWGWTQGLLPYRDVFDNHAPLFHALSAPLVALIGENPRIVTFMRLAMLPFFAAALAGSFLLGRRLFGTRAGLWSAALCGLSPTFFFKSLEYRTDVVWAALWVAAIVVLMGGRLTAARGLAGGLLLGACLAVSLKTVMLLLALGIAAAGVFFLAPRRVVGDARRRFFPYAAAVLGGLALPPACIVLYFAARGALPFLIDCTLRHNLLPGVGRWGYSIRGWLLAPLIALLLVAARYLPGRTSFDSTRAAFLLLLAGSQYVLLSTVWPVHTRQDLLPFYPLVCVLVAGFLLARRAPAPPAGERRTTWSLPRAALVPGVVACIELALLPALSPIAAHGTARQERLLTEVLALTDPGDYVLDLKGQAVFRRRPYYYALETMTLERMARGLIQDTIPESCIAKRAYVAPADIKGFPPRTRDFLRENYVVVGAWRVAGRVLETASPVGDPPAFDIVVPGRYALLSESAASPGGLDGRPYDRPLDLLPGRHVLQPAAGAGRVAVIWAQAAERGFSPFGPAGGTR